MKSSQNGFRVIGCCLGKPMGKWQVFEGGVLIRRVTMQVVDLSRILSGGYLASHGEAYTPE